MPSGPTVFFFRWEGPHIEAAPSYQIKAAETAARQELAEDFLNLVTMALGSSPWSGGRRNKSSCRGGRQLKGALSFEGFYFRRARGANVAFFNARSDEPNIQFFFSLCRRHYANDTTEAGSFHHFHRETEKLPDEMR
jgi:hypothetical protein